MSLIFAVALTGFAEPALAAPAGGEPATAEPVTAPPSERSVNPASLEEPGRDEIEARRVVELSQRLDDPRKRWLSRNRVALCRDLVPKQADLAPKTLAQLKAACPSWFPVPAPPTFCRLDPCVTDVSLDEGAQRTADASR